MGGRSLTAVICAVGLCAALTASAAGRDKPGRAPVHPAIAYVTSAHSRARGATASAAGSSDTVYTAPWSSHSIVTPDYIYVPASALSPDPLSPAEECAGFGTGCTAAQLCDLWSICPASPEAAAGPTGGTASDPSQATPP